MSDESESLSDCQTALTFSNLFCFVSYSITTNVVLILYCKKKCLTECPVSDFLGHIFDMGMDLDSKITINIVIFT